MARVVHDAFAVFLLGGGGLVLPAVDASASARFVAPFLSNAVAGAYDVAVTDLDGDGRPDLVAGGYSGGLSVLRGRGDGTFEPHVEHATPGTVKRIEVGDLNGDGHPDLVIAGFGAWSISAFLGDGLGGFGAPTTVSMGDFSYPADVAIGDIDGDGMSDVAVVNWGFDTVSWLRGLGDGTFGARTDLATGHYPVAVVLSDVTDDGRPDLIVTAQSAETVSIRVNQGGGAFAAPNEYPTGLYPGRIAVADLDGNGHLDLVVAADCTPCAFVSVYLGR